MKDPISTAHTFNHTALLARKWFQIVVNFQTELHFSWWKEKKQIRNTYIQCANLNYFWSTLSLNNTCGNYKSKQIFNMHFLKHRDAHFSGCFDFIPLTF